MSRPSRASVSGLSIVSTPSTISDLYMLRSRGTGDYAMLQGKIIWLTPPLILQLPYHTPPCAKSRKRTCLLTPITSVFRLAVRRYVYIFPHHQLAPRALSTLRSDRVAHIDVSEGASATGRNVSRTSTACTFDPRARAAAASARACHGTRAGRRWCARRHHWGAGPGAGAAMGVRGPRSCRSEGGGRRGR